LVSRFITNRVSSFFILPLFLHLFVG